MTIPELTPDMARMAQVCCLRAGLTVIDSRAMVVTLDQWHAFWDARMEYARSLSGLTGFKP